MILPRTTERRSYNASEPVRQDLRVKEEIYTGVLFFYMKFHLSYYEFHFDFQRETQER